MKGPQWENAIRPFVVGGRTGYSGQYERKVIIPNLVQIWQCLWMAIWVPTLLLGQLPPPLIRRISACGYTFRRTLTVCPETLPRANLTRFPVFSCTIRCSGLAENATWSSARLTNSGSKENCNGFFFLTTIVDFFPA